ncbi:hypothetical protein ACO22_01784 [Paracoccidioides brasiliensis]|uniref:Alpha/beta hydrolase fold-3 domain-containing protein n=1 Tax=Paracoccidioides brasiliensis TaxID=121759 RepID=A0A1D2JKT4_PARBR|nr:hypothetical protein ACO22_01784 [Paracoccidioides brasiliensis]
MPDSDLNRFHPSTPMLPLPGSPSFSWATFRGRFQALFNGADLRVCAAFWLFGLINNVLYVIILSAALDLVGPSIPKSVVLLADVVPSFIVKLCAPYFIHAIPYPIRVLIFVTLSASGMLLIAISPSYIPTSTPAKPVSASSFTSVFSPANPISTKMLGVILASLSSGGGELSFLGLTHYYGPFGLAAWGSGTGAAGLIGAGAYALATTTFGFSVKVTLLFSAGLPLVMLVSFFMVLPLAPLKSAVKKSGGYRVIDEDEGEGDVDSVLGRGHRSRGMDDGHVGGVSEREGLMGRDSEVVRAEEGKVVNGVGGDISWMQFKANLKRAKGLFFPFMLPLLLVYIAEYTINQGVSPTLLFPLSSTPFSHFRAFYPAYNAIYQTGVFISRSSTPFFRIHDLYLPSFLQVINLVVLVAHALFNFLPNVYVVFLIVFWEGLLGGLVYVNTFAEITEKVPKEEREFSLGATTVSDSGGICVAGFLGMAVEVWLCDWQVRRGRGYCRQGNNHGPPGIRLLSSRLYRRLTPWQATVMTFLGLYLSRNFAKLVGLESPEPLANLYSRSYFRATWVTTALDAGFWTAMNIKRKWLRDIASVVFSIYYLIAAEHADEKVRKVRAVLTVEHLRVSWNKGTTPYLSFLSKLMRPRVCDYSPIQIRIPRPRESAYTEPCVAWLYYNGPLSTLKDQTNVVLDIPGGGFVAMSPRTSDDKLLAWAGKTGVPILSLDYKKAPEHPYPYALNECYDVYHTIVSSRGRCLGLSGKVRPNIVITGDSAGGNLAAGVTLMILQSGSADLTRKLKGKGEGDYFLPPPAGLVLIYPALDMNIGSWMTDEEMSLIRERGMRKTNRNVLRRKSEEYMRLTPAASYLSTADANANANACDDSSDRHPVVHDYFAQQHAGIIHEEHPPSLNIENIDTPVPGNTASHLITTMTTSAQQNPKQIKTRLAVSSIISYFNDRILTPEMMRAMIILYIGPYNRPDFSTDYLLSPLLAPESLLSRFPKTYFLTGERDPLVDDTVIFAGRIRRAKMHAWRERADLGLERVARDRDRNGDGDESGFNERKAPRSSQEEKNVPSCHHPRRLTGESSGEEDKPLEMSMLRMTKKRNTASSPSTSTFRSTMLQENGTATKIAAGSSTATLRPSDVVPTTGTTPPVEEGQTPCAVKSQSPTGSGSVNGDRNFSANHGQTLEKQNGIHEDEEDDDKQNTPPWRKNVMMKISLQREKSLTSLPSEEDLLGRRMEGLAGGLMGIGEGARTP